MTERISYSAFYEGIDGCIMREFATLAEIQDYVRKRWEGTDYIDGESSFHNDYGQITLIGCTLADLGQRGSEDSKEQGYWDWTWKELTEEKN